MKIKNIQLSKFGMIDKTNLSFSEKGFNLISGENGSGKSTVMKAIAYMLLNHTPKKIEDLLNWRADTFTASMDFEHTACDYSVSCGYSRSNNKTEKSLNIVGGDGKGFYQNSDATEALKTRFEPSLCKASITSFQGETDLIQATPAVRRDILKKIYDLDFKAEIDKLGEEIEVMRGGVVRNTEDTIYLLDNKEYKYYPEIELNLDEGDYKSLLTSRDELKAKIASVQNDIDNWDSVMQEITALRSKISNGESEVVKKKESIADLDKVIDGYREETYRLKEEKGALVPARLPKFDNEAYQKLRKDLMEADTLVAAARASLEAVSRAECPTCGRPFSTEDRTPYQIKLDEKIKIYEDLHKEHEEAYRRSEEHAERSRLEEEKRTKVQEIVSKIDSLESKLESSIREQATLAEFVAGSDSLISGLKNELKNKSKTYTETKPVIKQSWLDDLTCFETAIKEYNDLKSKKEFQDKANEETHKQEKKDKKELKRLQAELKELLDQVDIIKEAQGILKKDFPNYVIAKMVAGIEAEMNMFLERAYAGRYTVKIIENASGLSIVYGERDKDVALASGAEQDIINISLKIAFCKLSGLKMLILDEVDRFMSESIAKHVFSIINDMLASGELSQIFVITHKESLKELIETEFGAKVFMVSNGAIVG